MSTPIIAAVTRLTAASPDAPRIVTVTRKPAAGLFNQFFGDHSVHNLILADPGATLRSPVGQRVFADLGAAADVIAAEAGSGLILRFVDAATVRLVAAAVPGLIDAARATWLQLRDPGAQAEAIDAFAARGFVHRIVSTMPPAELVSRDPIAFDAAPDYATARAGRLDTLVLLDNNLTGERGHYLSVATRIAAGAQQAGVRTIWAANRRLAAAAVPRGVELEAVFATSIFDVAKEAQATTDLAGEIAAAWRDLFARHDSPATHFLVPTTDGHFVRAVHLLLEQGAAPAGVIHLATPYETRHMASRHGGRELDWYLRAIVAHPLYGRRLFLWGETGTLAARHALRLDADVRALPLPAPSWAIETEPPAATGPLRIVFLGEARLDKGSLELPEIAAALIAGGPHGAVRVVVQLVPPYGGYGDELQEAVDRLRGVAGVEIVEGVLDDAAYRALVAGAHAVLMPYRPENYAVRGSGILIEALAAGRILLASAGTTAEEYADQGRVYLGAEPGDWTGMVRDILADRATIQRTAWRLGKRFCKRHAPRAYIDRLAARVEFA